MIEFIEELVFVTGESHFYCVDVGGIVREALGNNGVITSRPKRINSSFTKSISSVAWNGS